MVTEADRKVITTSRLFGGLEGRELEEALERLEVCTRVFAKGQMIFHEGDVLQAAGILLSGEVRISRISIEGNENLFQKLSASYLLGADIVCTPTRISPYTACCSQESKIWFFDYEKIRTPGILAEDTRIYLQEQLIQFIANENIRNFYKVDMLSSKNIREKILKYLEIQKRKGKNGMIEIPYDREELANYLCMNRSVLSHTLSQMRKEGILDFHRNRFVLKDRE